MAEVEFQVEQGVARITLNRPEVHNAISHEMDRKLRDIWLEINRSDEIRVAVLAAKGDRTFCAGRDIKDTPADSERIGLGGGLTGLGGPLVKLDKPLVAAVQGFVLGGGFELAMCADLIVCSDDAQFGLPEVPGGHLGEAGVFHRVIRQLPYRVAMSMILTGERLDALRAFDLGLVNQVVAPKGLKESANRIVATLLELPKGAADAAKQATLAGYQRTLDDALASRYEAIEAFVESRRQD